MTTTNLPIVTPDFDSLQNGFRTYLESQPEYTDYNFRGSGSSILLDVLSLNTTYLAFFLNQIANESRLYTAAKRSKIVSAAHDLGYIAKTASASKATIQYEFIKANSSDPFVSFSVTPQLSATSGNTNYIFSTTTPINIVEVNGRYLSEPFDVIEGKRFTFTQRLTDDILKNGFVIPNLNVDIKHTTVDITTSNNITTTYSPFSDILSVKSTDNIFFYHENADGRLVIKFGDGIIGSTPNVGSVITVRYLVCSGSITNGIDLFESTNTISSGTINVLVVNKSAGGDEPESIQSIRTLAPLMYTTQNRAVIDSDYVAILKSKYPNIDDVIAYGGDELDPPQYGKIVIVVKPKNGLYLTTYDKSNISDFIKKYNIVTIRPIILEPDYIYINMRINVLYDYTRLTITESDLKNKISKAIDDFESQQLSSFDKDFRYSVFLRTIDFCDQSIVANSTKIFLEKRLNPVLGGNTFIDLSFNNRLEEGTINTSVFTFNGLKNCFIDDSQKNGSLSVYRYQNNVKTLIANNIGIVNYITGDISIPSIIIEKLDNLDNVNSQTGELFLSVYSIPYDNDVVISQRNIGQINTISLSLSKV